MALAARVQRQPDAAAVAEQAAERLLAGLAGPRPVGLATGRTMEPVYGALRRRLAALPAAQRSGAVVPRAWWIAGLALFKQGRFGDAARGFDHGAFVPMAVLWPASASWRLRTW